MYGGVGSHAINAFFLFRFMAVVVVILALGATFVGMPMMISGQSMEPNFSSGQAVFVGRGVLFQDQGLRRGDVVAARFPADPRQTKLVKRIIGLPGETIAINEDGEISINGRLLDEQHENVEGAPPYDFLAEYTMQDNEYFLIGDNRPGSSDSRLWGPVKRTDIEGRILYILFPFNQIKYIANPY